MALAAARRGAPHACAASDVVAPDAAGTDTVLDPQPAASHDVQAERRRWAPEFAPGVLEGTAEVTEEAPGVFSLDFLTAESCDKLVEFAGGPQALFDAPPNTLNRQGATAESLQVCDAVHELLVKAFDPLARRLFPEWLHPVAGLDSFHAFVVGYDMVKQRGLNSHIDASDVTLNLCIGGDFVGGGLTLCGLSATADRRKLRGVYQHRKGRAVLHSGMLRHGALELESGYRFNLIVWGYSGARRAEFGGAKSLVPRDDVVGPSGKFVRSAEDGPPDPLCDVLESAPPVDAAAERGQGAQA